MWRYLFYLGSFMFLAGVMSLIATGIFLWRMSASLPTYEHLASYKPPLASRIYAANGDLLAEYGEEKRIETPYDYIPPKLVEAFVAAEDQHFFTHAGIDGEAIFKASLRSVINAFRGRRLVGGSTITQQVARNFFLNREVRFLRKIREALLALRLERVLSKEEIMALYLNEIYLGKGTYGITYAAYHYFDKKLNELSLAEIAYLAALPKGPANYDPIHQRERALARRNWVLGRMVEEGYLNQEQAGIAQAKPLKTIIRKGVETPAESRYFVEEIRRWSVKEYGRDKLYRGGLSIRTTLVPEMQQAARAAVREGVEAYDRRRGYRGVLMQLPRGAYWPVALREMTPPAGIAPLRMAVVLALDPEGVYIGLRPEKDPTRKKGPENLFQADKGYVRLEEMRWAWNRTGKPVQHPRQILEEGDVIYVEPIELPPEQAIGYDAFALRQIPEVNAALVAIDPHTGRVLAMSGGYNFTLSQFNRVTQAWRQPGSAFKPFVYAAALDNGYTPASLLLDVPFATLKQNGEGYWRPANYSRNFHRQSTLRVALEKSRNLSTVHLAQSMGIVPIMEYAKRFGIATQIRPELTLVLGAEETTLMRLTTAYAMLVNGGKQIDPFLVERIQDPSGKTIYRGDQRVCWQCNITEWQNDPPPTLPDTRTQVISPQTAYQIVSILEGAVRRGTGVRAQSSTHILAGKTGTTDDAQDAWFIGFSPDLTVGVYVGYDTPQPLGKKESGGRVAAPVFSRFMTKALSGKSPTPFRIPGGIRLVSVDAETGELLTSEVRGNAILESFKVGTEPVAANTATHQEVSAPNRVFTPAASDTGRKRIEGTGGLY